MTTFELDTFNRDLNGVVERILQLPKEQRSELYKAVDEMLNS